LSVAAYWLYELLGIYWWILVARLIFEWIPAFSPTWRPKGALLVVAEFLYTVTDPPVKLVRKVIPPIRVGTNSFDISYIILLFGIQILESFLVNL
jgi:YggT family protein